LIIDADDGGSLYKQGFTVKGEKISFGKAQKVKVKYVNASHGGIEVQPINQDRQHLALFDTRRDSLPKEVEANTIDIVLGRGNPATGDEVEVKLKKGLS
jgi:hypothetical protein